MELSSPFLDEANEREREREREKERERESKEQVSEEMLGNGRVHRELPSFFTLGLAAASNILERLREPNAAHQ